MTATAIATATRRKPAAATTAALATSAPPAPWPLTADLSPADYLRVRNDLTVANDGLVGNVLQIYFTPLPEWYSGTVEDIMQAGRIALIRAVENYDQNRISTQTGQPAAFSTVASRYIFTAMRREIEAVTGIIRVPPTGRDLQPATAAAAYRCRFVVSLSDLPAPGECGYTEQSTGGDRQPPDPKADDPLARLAEDDVRDELWTCLMARVRRRQVSARDWKILYRTVGCGETLEAAGLECDEPLSRERVRQIRDRLIDLLARSPREIRDEMARAREMQANAVRLANRRRAKLRRARADRRAAALTRERERKRKQRAALRKAGADRG